ncbi:aminotransferase class IV [Amycolatopsis sp. NPDC051071]|uniref:aminotransferase class IV n=1 Tax=Amycolatopsis sp. NPDC051071 TaxID=3154637 RepID=UPI00342C6BAD
MTEAHAPLVWWHGEVVTWAEATVPVTAFRGFTVYDGLRAYWRADEGKFAVIQLDGHLDRLRSAADLLHVHDTTLLPELRTGIGKLLAATSFREDVYLRLTLYVDAGRSNVYPDVATPGRNEQLAPVGAFASLHRIGPRKSEPITAAVSSWQRAPDTSFPVLVKTSATYAMLRLARVEARQAGADQAILLNTRGMVAETAEAVVFVARHGRLYTPPLSDGVLDSLTRQIIIELARKELGIDVVECSISRSELYLADEVFICGTWEELRIVSSVDGHRTRHGNAPIGTALKSAYVDMCTGKSAPLDEGFATLLP